MEISYSEYHNLVSRIEELERNSLTENAIFVPLCIGAFALVVLTIILICICIDIKKNRSLYE